MTNNLKVLAVEYLCTTDENGFQGLSFIQIQNISKFE
jgi:hypothetical protein